MKHSWFTVQANSMSQVVWCQTCGCLKLNLRDLGSANGWTPSYRKVGSDRWSTEEPACVAEHPKEGQAS